MKHPHRIGKLRRNVYGNRQGGQSFIEGVKEHLKFHKCKQLKNDPRKFIKWHDNKKYIIIALCTDDFLAGATHTSLHEELHNTLKKKYTLKRLGPPTQYLNWKIIHTTKGIHVSQPHIISFMVEKLKLQNAADIAHLCSDGISLELTKADEKPCPYIQPLYDEVVGDLRYLADCTRYGIDFAVNALARSTRNRCARH